MDTERLSIQSCDKILILSIIHIKHETNLNEMKIVKMIYILREMQEIYFISFIETSMA